MTENPILRRWLAIGGTAFILAAVVGLAILSRESQTGGPPPDGRGPVDTLPNPLGSSLKAAEKAAEKAPAGWPLWGGTLQRNPVNLTEKGIARDWISLPGKEKNIAWSADLGSKAYGGPTIGGGKIFVGTNNNRPRDKDIRGDKGIIMCFEESTGKFLWQLVHDKLEAGRVNDWPEEGICSAPVIEGNYIWYVSNRCEVLCYDISGAKPKNVWTLDMIKSLGVFPHNLATCSPMIVGDTLFVITSNGVDEKHINLPAPNAPSFLAINKKKGNVIWQSNLPGSKVMHGQWSNPVYTEANGAPQVIFPGGDGYIYSFNPKDGALLWKFDCNPKGSKYFLGPKGTRNDFVSTPVIYDNKLYIGVGQDPEHKKSVGHLWCIDITKKPTNKDKDLSPWSDPKEEAPQFDPKDPRNKDSALVWHYGGADKSGDDVRGYLFGRTMSTCALYEGLCFAADFDGFVYCFDAKTGKLHWKEDTDKELWSSPFVVDGHMYIGNDGGEMRIFKADKTMKLVKTVKMRGKIRATPVALSGVLYVMTENPTKLWAIKK